MKPRARLSGEGAFEIRVSEVNKMLRKGIVGRLFMTKCLSLYSRIFLVEEASGGWRPLIDLLQLNTYVSLLKFRVEMAGNLCHNRSYRGLNIRRKRGLSTKETEDVSVGTSEKDTVLNVRAHMIIQLISTFITL